MVLGVIAASRSSGRNLKPLFCGHGHRHRLAVAQQHHFGIRHPERRRDHDLVARIDRRDHRVVQHLLAAGADRDLRGLVIEPVLALELAADRALQFDRAVERRVSGLAAPHRRDRRLLDIWRGVEIGLADRQADDIACPAAFNSVASAVIAIVGEGLTRARRSARKDMTSLRCKEKADCEATRQAGWCEAASGSLCVGLEDGGQ